MSSLSTFPFEVDNDFLIRMEHMERFYWDGVTVEQGPAILYTRAPEVKFRFKTKCLLVTENNTIMPKDICFPKLGGGGVVPTRKFQKKNFVMAIFPKCFIFFKSATFQ